MLYLYVVEGMKLATNIRHLLKRFSRLEVRGQGNMYKYANAITAEAYISLVWH